jgi:hypothetical protein
MYTRHGITLSLCAVLLAAGAHVEARMYQWVSARSGSVQLSGDPPPWYRAGGEDDPRVRVFENGNLIDDTAIALPRSQREELRTSAFQEAEQRQRAEALKRLERAARLEKSRQAEIERLAAVEREREQAERTMASDGSAAAPQRASVESLVEGPLDEDTVARLKAIIGEFDRQGGGLVGTR